MQVGMHAGYWSAGPPPGSADAIAAADRMGIDSVWTAEAYGSDALTPLAWWGAATTRMTLGTAVVQMPARTPTATAMAALTLDHLSGGRFVLGLGASGPQVVEGWYGQPYAHPLARTKEYVGIVRQVFARSAPVTAPGPHYPLPLPDGTGLGKPLRSTVHPLRSGLPIYLAAQGPRNVALAAEIADGWLPWFFSPRMDGTYREWLSQGFARRSAGLSPARDFQVAATVPVVVDDDVEQAADQLRPMVALYIGGMGGAGANFHRNVLDRLGYAEVCAHIQAEFLAGRTDAARAAVPRELIEDIALIGPTAKIARDLESWHTTVVTQILVSGDATALATVAGILHGESPRG